MAEQTKIEKIEQENEERWEPGELTGDLYNLACTYSYLSEIDSQMLGKREQARLAKMKSLLFDAISYYCDELPDLRSDE